MKVVDGAKVCGVCGHVAQLTQSIGQLSLKPAKKRSRKKMVDVLEMNMLLIT